MTHNCMMGETHEETQFEVALTTTKVIHTVPGIEAKTSFMKQGSNCSNLRTFLFILRDTSWK